MRSFLIVVAMLAIASVAQAQHTSPPDELPVEKSERVSPPPAPAAAPAVGSAPSSARTEVPEAALPFTARQEGPSRVTWFLIGALTVAAILLALLL